MHSDASMQLNVVAIRPLTTEITEYRFARPDGGVLPEFTPGAHITVTTPAGANRRYSLVNAGDEPREYVIAVKRERVSRGGSQSMHEDVVMGMSLDVTPPENSFPLESASRYLLIAGGIGVTPILAMSRALAERGAHFEVIYCTRSEELTAYADELRALAGARLTIHHDQGDPTQVFDFWDHFATPSTTHVYCCGPKPLMEEIKAISGHWSAQQIHFEDFKPVEVTRAVDQSFEVCLASTGQIFQVPDTRSILETLRSAGVRVPSSCESGTCGSCRMQLVAGEVEHRDYVLVGPERESYIMVCVSRGRDRITVDFE
jgi:phthalate 4,5-dioxygenase reductase component